MQRIALLCLAAGLAIASCGTPTPTDTQQDIPSEIGNGRIAFVGVSDNDYVIDVVNSDGTGWRTLTQPGAWGEYDLGPAWSPDGNRIAFLRYSHLDEDGMGDYELFVTGSDGSNPSSFTQAKGAANPAWSPDGEFIAFDRAENEHGAFRSHIFVIGADGTGERRITEHPLNDYSPAWSPDGSRLVFERYAPDGEVDIYTIASDGTELRQLTQTSGYDGEAAWSPDGSKIAFVHWKGGGHGVYVMDADGSNRRLLADPLGAEVAAPVWSPDGSTIAFQVYEGGDWDILLVHVDSSELTRVTDDRGDETEPVWSPDGELIAYYSSEVPSSDRDNSGTFDVFVIEPDGSGKTRLTERAGALGAGLSWQSRSP
jgi:Tol biopolymer transport system component